MENSEVEKVEDSEVICGKCNGQWQTIEVNDTTPRLFRLRLYKKLVIQCNVCGKTSKIYTERIKK